MVCSLQRVFAVVDVYGNTQSVAVTSVRSIQGPTEVEGSDGVTAAAMAESLRSSKLHDSLEMLLDTATPTLQSARLPYVIFISPYLLKDLKVLYI